MDGGVTRQRAGEKLRGLAPGTRNPAPGRTVLGGCPQASRPPSRRLTSRLEGREGRGKRGHRGQRPGDGSRGQGQPPHTRALARALVEEACAAGVVHPSRGLRRPGLWHEAVPQHRAPPGTTRGRQDRGAPGRQTRSVHGWQVLTTEGRRAAAVQLKA